MRTRDNFEGTDNAVTIAGWVKHFLIYGLGIVLMNLLPILMVPIYTHRVSPSIYGVLELLNRSQELLLLILSFGLQSASVVFYQMAKSEPGRQKGIYSTALQFVCSVGLGAIILTMLGAHMWSGLLFGTGNYTNAILLILVATYFEMIFQLAVLYLQSELRSALYVTIFVSRALVALVLNLLFVYLWDWGLMGILWATVLHTTAYSIALFFYILRKTGLHFDRVQLGQMLRFGAPLVIAALASFLLNNGDRYFLNHYGSAADVGLYGLGYRAGMLSLSLVLAPFGKIWSVTMVDISKRSDGGSEFGKIATYLLLACAFSALGLSLLAPYLIRFFSDRSYWEAYRVVPIVSAAYIFYGWTFVMDAAFYVTRKTIYKVYSISLAGAVVLALYWWLIPKFGMMGAAWATLGGYASYSGFTAYFAHKVFPIHYQLGRLTLLFATALSFYELGSQVPIMPAVSGILIRSLVILAFPLTLLLMGFLKDEERRALGDYWQLLRLRYLGGAHL